MSFQITRPYILISVHKYPYGKDLYFLLKFRCIVKEIDMHFYINCNAPQLKFFVNINTVTFHLNNELTCSLFGCIVCQIRAACALEQQYMSILSTVGMYMYLKVIVVLIRITLHLNEERHISLQKLTVVLRSGASCFYQSCELVAVKYHNTLIKLSMNFINVSCHLNRAGLAFPVR